MTATHDQIEVISRIYDTILDPATWVNVLDDIVKHTGAHGSAVGLSDARSPEVQIESGSSIYPKNAVANYNAQFQSEDFEAYQTLTRYPAYKMYADADLFANDIPAQDRPALCFLRKQYGISHRAAARLNRDRGWIGVMTLQYHENHGPMTADEAMITNIFLPHLGKVMEIARPFMILKSRFRAVMAALDRFHVGVFILSSKGEAILRNREAERILDLKDGLSLDRSGRPLPAHEADDAALREAILKAVATADAEADQAESLLCLSRPSGGDGFLVEVTPMRDPGIELESGFTGAMMVVIDPMRTDVVSTDGIQTLYDLTGAESDICRLIVEGLRTDEIADTRQVARDTVRNQIQCIFQKTATRSRAQLVRLALAVNLPIDKPGHGTGES